MSEILKDQRALLVVANLVLGDSDDGGDYDKLYEWLDKYSVLVANMLMRPIYRVVESLTENRVTLTGFVDRVVQLALDPQTQALDVFLVMHGSDGQAPCGWELCPRCVGHTLPSVPAGEISQP